MAEMPDPIPGGSGRKSRDTGVGASSVTTREENDCRERERLMEVVVERVRYLTQYSNLIINHEPPYTEPYVRWCERRRAPALLLLDLSNTH